MPICALLLFICLLLTTDASAKQRKECSRDVVCIYSQQVAKVVTFEVENLTLYPVTVKLEPKLKNMVVEGGKSTIASYPGKSKTVALRIKPKDQSKGFGWSYTFKWLRGGLGVQHNDDFVYQLPFAKGQKYKLSQSFNGKSSHFGVNQYGLDFVMPEGTKVHATRGGKVVGIKQNSNSGCPLPRCRGQANYIVILHNDGTLGEYFHLQHLGALVNLGDRVETGQVIGLSGNTGWSGKAHLHFSIHSVSSPFKRQSHRFKLRTSQGVLSKPKAGQFYSR